MFQSLLSWKGHCKAAAGKCQPCGCRFNPCYLGRAIASPGREVIGAGEHEFQSLLSWKGHCKYRGSEGDPGGSTVSILVILEGPLQASGSDGDHAPRLPAVSILVILEGPLQEFRYPPCKNGIDGFNPCYLGRAIASTTTTHRSWGLCEFQSLLSWKGHCKFGLVFSYMGWLVSFNPCYLGRAIARAARRLPVVAPTGCFNPCYLGRAIARAPYLVELGDSADPAGRISTPGSANLPHPHTI